MSCYLIVTIQNMSSVRTGLEKSFKTKEDVMTELAKRRIRSYYYTVSYPFKSYSISQLFAVNNTSMTSNSVRFPACELVRVKVTVTTITLLTTVG